MERMSRSLLCIFVVYILVSLSISVSSTDYRDEMGYAPPIGDPCLDKTYFDNIIGSQLCDFTAPHVPLDIRYSDKGKKGYYENGDMIYLTFGEPLSEVKENDIRLVRYDLSDSNKSLDPGSKVRPGDEDLGNAIRPFSTALSEVGFYFLDCNNNKIFDNTTIDPCYLIPPGYSPIRMSMNLPINGSNSTCDLVHDSKFIPMIRGFPIRPCQWMGSMATIKFLNINGNCYYNGNPVYDYDDYVFIDVPFIPFYPSMVSKGDLLISPYI